VVIRACLWIGSDELRVRLRKILETRGVVVQELVPGDEAWSRLPGESVDLVFAAEEDCAPGVGALVERLRVLPDRPDVVVIPRRSEPPAASSWLAKGCLAALDARVDDAVLAASVRALVEGRRETREARLDSARQARARLEDFVSKSATMEAFLATVRRILPTEAALLILGETGVGKERLARAIHNEGARASGPFLAVNCAAVPESLLESELFGHEQGAFTGASRSRRGCFELAHHGTLLLDEIGEMPGSMQAKLLRVLQDFEVRRVGGEKPISVDVRVMAATNRDLLAEVAERRFREDLYYRLGVMTLTVPPLRERVEDIPDLVGRYLEVFRIRFGRGAVSVSDRALEALRRHSWPGNVRELANVIERGVLLCSSDSIDLGDLAPQIASPGTTEARGERGERVGLVLPESLFERPWSRVRYEAIDRVEREYLVRLLTRHRGRVGDAAQEAGIAARSLFEKLRRHDLRKEDFKHPSSSSRSA